MGRYSYVLAVLCCVLTLICSTVATDEKQAKYPESGKVVAVRMVEHSSLGSAKFDARPKWNVFVYRVETATAAYELESQTEVRNPVWATGEELRFRVDDKIAVVLRGNEAEKYNIIKVEQLPKS